MFGDGIRLSLDRLRRARDVVFEVVELELRRLPDQGGGCVRVVNPGELNDDLVGALRRTSGSETPSLSMRFRMMFCAMDMRAGSTFWPFGGTALARPRGRPGDRGPERVVWCPGEPGTAM